MRVALIMGRGGSKSIPEKNVVPVLGRPLVLYPIIAALDAKQIDRVAVTSDCEEILAVAGLCGIEKIERPPELSHDTAQMVDGITHALEQLGGEIDFLVTMHANCATHTPDLIDRCLTRLLEVPEADSCVSGVEDRAVHPFRTRKLTVEGELKPWVEIPAGTSSNRQSLEPCIIVDGAARAMRVASCIPPKGDAPFPYLGNRVLFEENLGGRDVHDEDDLLLSEHFLVRHGWTPEQLPDFLSSKPAREADERGRAFLGSR